MSFEKNPYDGHTLPAALEQCERLTEQRSKVALVDLGYRGAKEVGGTQILYAGRVGRELKGSAYYRMKRKLGRRASIEPRIGHLKARFRLGRNFLKGISGTGQRHPDGVGDELGELDGPVPFVLF